jgi:maltose-binding protein MalE
MKKILAIAFIVITAFTLMACSGDKGPVVIWVGEEVQEFYQEQADDYIVYYNSNHDSEFPFEIEVRAADTGTAAGVFLDDTSAGPDILTVAHDNLGRLIGGSPAIAPIENADLISQIQSQNPESFLNVIKGDYEGQTYTFGVPYEAQALILYYNAAYLTPTDVESWEGIWAKATELEMNSTTVTGQDGFNNSFLVLATNATTGEPVTKIYEGGDLQETSFVNDEAISVIKWGQRFFSDIYGAVQASDSGWQVDLDNEQTLSLVGGSWHFNAAQAALGDDLGVAKLPTFTLTADDVYGDVAANTVMQSGTFTDTKMFVMNRRSSKLNYLEDILLYLSHKDIQEESYLQNGTLPAYKDALEEFEGMDGSDIRTQLAIAQIEMFNYGRPQPFGIEARFNVYYYQRQAPELLFELLSNKDEFNTDALVIARMQEIENTWMNIRE